MPLYEFYCQSCHMIFTFRALRVDVTSAPTCPRCNGQLKREVSAFAHIIRGASESRADADDRAAERMESVMAQMGERMQALEDDDGDPREAVSVLRAMAEAGGVQFKPEVMEAMARIDAGEDPDKIDEMFGELFDTENPFCEPDEDSTAASMNWWQRLHEPQRDPEWHDWPVRG
ncbi:MAG: zinc ribbon domain-containing protein [Kiritimatiellae bacterium]|nr:zinc ribbon domain-containing protein [Kiritimatiellia bacterium]